jgi:arylsulfatase A-like enzyme
VLSCLVECVIGYSHVLFCHRFIQIWFNAPHGPWEPLKAGEELYSAKHDKPANFWKGYTCKAVRDQPAHPLYSQNWSYKTMVAAMDRSIGRVLDAVKELGLEEDTLIVFTSDNGNEMGAGGPGIYREGKRSLMVIRPLSLVFELWTDYS